MKELSPMIFVLLIIKLGQPASATGSISCETLGNDSWYRIGALKSCRMRGNTSITSDSFIVNSPADSSVLGMTFYSNKNIFYLPIRVSENFPNLVAFGAGYCSIKALYKSNFKNLFNLKNLELSSNQIEKIESGIFGDLTSLEILWLDDNKIKQINGLTFVSLIKLKEIALGANICINKNYDNPNAITRTTIEVIENCGLEDFAGNMEAILKHQTDQKNQIESLTENLKKEKLDLLAENEKLKTKLKAANLQLENQISTAKSLYSELKLNESCTQMTKALGESFNKKLKVISGLLDRF